MEWYLKVLKQYATFGGRARRKEYWMFTLFTIIAYIVAMVLDNMLGLTIGDIGYGYLYLGYTLFVFLPSLAVSVRRLHDRDLSGWWILIGLVPVIGAILLLVWSCMEGTQGDNRFGPDPKAMPA